MSFASSAAATAFTLPAMTQITPMLQMFEDFLEPYRAFAQALNGALRSPAQVMACADWRPHSLRDRVERAFAPARADYARLPDDIRAELEALAHDLECKSLAALIHIRRQQRLGNVQDLTFIEHCRRLGRKICDSQRAFEAALDPLLAPQIMTRATMAAPVPSHHQAPALELITNVTLG